MKIQKDRPSYAKYRMAGFILFLMVIFVSSQLLIPKNVYAVSNVNRNDMERSVIPEGATKLTLHDLGLARPILSKGYEVYSRETKAELITEVSYLKFKAASQNEKNGIKLDITQYLKEGSSGRTFGCSLQTKVEGWIEQSKRNNKSRLYFEVYDKKGNLKTKKLLASIKPDQDNSNMTTWEYRLGTNWSNQLLKGETVLNFEATDRVYISVLQKSQVQFYDKLYLWYYDDTDKKDDELTADMWVGTWGSAQLTATGNVAPPNPGLSGNTYRQAVRVSIGGNLLRIKFSNEYGTTPLEINSAYIARLMEYGSSKIDPKTNTPVTFEGGKKKITIPAGKTVTSDAISFEFESLDYIAVSTLFGKVPNMITSHTASRSTNCLVAGNHVTEEEFKNYQTATSWYFLSDIDVYTTPEHYSIVCFGDSLTDGYGVKTNVIQRWSDILAERLQEDPDKQHISVINKGIGGNSIYGGNGPAAYQRFYRDVVETAGIKYVIILIGTNDIGFTYSDNSNAIISKYKDMIEVAHKNGIKVYGGTITPFEGNSYYSVLHEQIRVKVNQWILSEASGFDGVIDFASALADPTKPSRMQTRFANDYLHPNSVGYAFMADIINLSMFK